MISIIDYGLGNLSAFASAYHQLQIPYEIVSNAEKLKDPSHIILPGVGSFDGAMKKISDSGFDEVLTYYVKEKEVMVLGVCIGLQIMCKESEEGKMKGLSWIDAETVKIRNDNLSGRKLKLPHLGWNDIQVKKECPLLKGLENEEFYFLHSYNIKNYDSNYVSSTVDYGSHLTASISVNNIFGTQFHPEKSHLQGIKLLENFASIR